MQKKSGRSAFSSGARSRGREAAAAAARFSCLGWRQTDSQLCSGDNNLTHFPSVLLDICRLTLSCTCSPNRPTQRLSLAVRVSSSSVRGFRAN